MRLTLAEVAAATGGLVSGDAATEVSSFHTDSRQLAAGGLFVALKGAEQDGHRYLEAAFANGAAAALVERPSGLGPEVIVPATWGAFYALAAGALERVRPLTIGITGSNGKTSTKEMTAAVLGKRLRVHATAGNLNTETGVPMTILGMPDGAEALVLEMGMQGPGEIARLAALARPTVGVITSIGTVHLEHFQNREGIARAKAELIEALPEEGVAILPGDSGYLPLLRRLTRARVVTFGHSEAADYRVEGYRATESGSRFEVRGARVELSVPGRHMAANAAAALAAGDAAGVPPAVGAAALAGVGARGRFHARPAPGGFLVVDDAYNASPESMRAALETLAERPRRGRLLAVLGEMRELGSETERAHRELGALAGDVLDGLCVVAVGEGRLIAEAAGAKADLVPDREAAVAWVRAHARPGDVVLVKASHGVALERVVEELLEPAPA